MLIRLVARNDKYGNPRRGWLYITDSPRFTFYDEGYQGLDALPPELKDEARNAITLEITPKQYEVLNS